ncbi:WhiB family transcriptional regulator [Streptomyces ossamyceticus]|uniref:WhiB family transcriptional regulator n=1 Tax=Streptomyces ossamyceticus TaxID=249581 RepID=UPI0036E523D7
MGRGVIALTGPGFVRVEPLPLPCRVAPDLFFTGGAAAEGEAAAVCAGCVWMADCRAYALERPSLQGVWGGLTQDERRRWRNREGQRRRVATKAGAA